MKIKIFLITFTLLFSVAFVSCSKKGVTSEGFTDIYGNKVKVSSTEATSPTRRVTNDFSIPQETVEVETTLKVTSTVLGEKDAGKEMQLAYETKGINAPQYINFVLPADRGDTIPVTVVDTPDTVLKVKSDLLNQTSSVSANNLGYASFSLVIPENASTGYHTVSFSNSSGTLVIKFYIK